jgi:predicted N-acetyltransferase YhbS
MTKIRGYQEQDAAEVGLLIKNTYSEFNLDFLDPKDQEPFLGPFFYAGSSDQSHLDEIKRMIQSEVVLVAEDKGKIVGVLRGRMGRLGSLFVSKSHHAQGIGRSLVEHFEDRIRVRGGGVLLVASSLYAVPFYSKLGYKKSTGVRKSWSFQGYGFPIQPMKKILSNPNR